MTARHLLGGVSLLVLSAALLMHLASLTGGAFALPAGLGMALLLAEFVVLAAFVVSAARHFLREKPSAAGLRELFPGWVLPLVLVTALYSFGSFLLHVVGSGGETAVADGERYVLMSGSEEQREIGEAEYVALKAEAARAETAYSLVFVLVPCLWFLARRQRPVA